MISIKELLDAGVKIEERISEVIVYSKIVGIKDMDYMDIVDGDYDTTDPDDYYDFAERMIFINCIDCGQFCSILAPSDFQELVEESVTVEDFIEGAKERDCSW